MDLIKHKFLLHSFAVFSFFVCVLICYSLFGVETRLRVERYGVRNPAVARYVSVPQNGQTVAGAHQASFSMSRLQGFFSGGVKRKGREADYSPPFRAEVKNGWSYTSAPSVCLRGVNKDNCTFVC